MNLSELENALTSHEEPFSYTRNWGPNPGEVVNGTSLMDWHEYWAGDVPDDLEIPGVGKVSVEATHGGEGEGDQAWVVLRIHDEDGTTRYYRKDGYYASYDGAYFDGDFREVVPTPKTITVYKEAK